VPPPALLAEALPGIASASNSAPGSNAGGSFGLEDNFHSAPWTEAARGYLRAKWPDPDNAKEDIARALGRSVQSCEAQAFKMHLNRARGRPKFRAVVTDNFTTGRRAAEAAAERIRAYWARQGQTVRVELEFVPGPPGQSYGAWSAKILDRLAFVAPPVPVSPLAPPGEVVEEIPYKSERRMLHAGPPPRVPVPAVERECLNCRKSFTARGRFLRLCEYCRKAT